MTSGKYLTAALNGANIDGTHEWGVNERADRQEATTGADRGRGRKDVGVIDTMIRVVFYLSIVDGLFTFIRPGAELTNLQLFHDNEADTPLYSIGEARVFDSHVRGQVRGQMIVEAEIEAYGDVVEANDPVA